METLLIAVGAFFGYLIAYHTYGRWLAKTIFRLDPEAATPSVALNDDQDFVPTSKSVLFGHHFTSIAGTGPIVGPAIAVVWGWLPALLWVLFGSILVGAVHDFGALVVSMRNRGQTVGDIAGRVLTPRVRLLFLLILFMALTIVLAIFGLVIASVFKKYPESIFPCVVQVPIAVAIGVWLHRRGASLVIPSILALTTMYLSVVFGDQNTLTGVHFFDVTVGGALHQFNATLAAWPAIVWVLVLLIYSYVASVLPVWILLQPRDYINSLQLISALGLVVIGLGVAGFFGGAPLEPGGERIALELAAPAIVENPNMKLPMIPFLFITIACGACSGFHCLVSSGTSSKQISNETDAQFVGYGSMLTEGFLAVIVILACVSGLGLGVKNPASDAAVAAASTNVTVEATATVPTMLQGTAAFNSRYADGGGLQLGALVAAFVDGSANFLKAMGLPAGIAVALMGVLVASFAGTTLDTACRLQRYVIQELAGTFSRKSANGNVGFNPLGWLTNKHWATITAVILATIIAAFPAPGNEWTIANAGKGGLILWPLFGATNQLLAGLAFLVISFFLWRRGVPVWFIAIPMIFMLIVPAAAMLMELPNWIAAAQKGDHTKWLVVFIAIATLLLEAWMLFEAAITWPKVKGVLEESLPPLPTSAAVTVSAETSGTGR
ncbi:MAG: carbon starvation protein A [Planctomycetaceae bacterium]